jgi:hypothetical protein
MKVLPVEAGIFHSAGRTDMRKQIIAFRNFAKALKAISFICPYEYRYNVDFKIILAYYQS